MFSRFLQERARVCNRPDTWVRHYTRRKSGLNVLAVFAAFAKMRAERFFQEPLIIWKDDLNFRKKYTAGFS